MFKFKDRDIRWMCNQWRNVLKVTWSSLNFPFLNAREWVKTFRLNWTFLSKIARDFYLTLAQGKHLCQLCEGLIDHLPFLLFHLLIMTDLNKLQRELGKWETATVSQDLMTLRIILKVKLVRSPFYPNINMMIRKLSNLNVWCSENQNLSIIL